VKTGRIHRRETSGARSGQLGPAVQTIAAPHSFLDYGASPHSPVARWAANRLLHGQLLPDTRDELVERKSAIVLDRRLARMLDIRARAVLLAPDAILLPEGSVGRALTAPVK
jgi:hypothetical protein